MPIARTINETWSYVLKSEKDESDPTTFLLGAVKQATLEGRVADMIGAGKVFEAYDAVLLGGGLRGWTGLRDENGNEIKFRGKDAATTDDLARLAPGHRVELGAEVFGRNNLTQEESD